MSHDLVTCDTCGMIYYFDHGHTCSLSLADDPQALARMAEHFVFLFGDLGYPFQTITDRMAELIGAAEGGTDT